MHYTQATLPMPLTSSHASRVGSTLCFLRVVRHSRIPFSLHVFSARGCRPGFDENSIPSRNLCISFASNGFVIRSASILPVPTLRNFIRPESMISCTQRKHVWMCLTFPRPRRLPMDIPVVASMLMTTGHCMPQSDNIACSPRQALAVEIRP